MFLLKLGTLHYDVYNLTPPLTTVIHSLVFFKFFHKIARISIGTLLGKL